MRKVRVGCNAAQQVERAEERAVLIRSGDDDEWTPVPHGPLEPESMRSNVSWNCQPRKSNAKFIERADDGLALAGVRMLRACHAGDAALKLLNG
jgi:hypothetical protein